jgi:cysteinyl-tRNA synthetase
MEWDSPWGKGFPGWHIECSAMSSHYLGNTVDIHCGGVDHIPIHHTNEIAQSEACSGQKFVNYWLHGEFLIEEKGKMSKSAGVFLRLQTLIDEGYSPLDYRYFLLMTHYRKKIKFSFDNLDAARNGYANLKCRIKNLKSENTAEIDKSKKEFSEFQKKFIVEINDDLNVTGAMAVLWDMLKDEKLNSAEKLYLAYDFDKIFALDLGKVEAEKLSTDLPPEIIELAEKRKEAKKNKDFKSADELRNRLKEKGYEIVDTKSGYELSELK